MTSAPECDCRPLGLVLLLASPSLQSILIESYRERSASKKFNGFLHLDLFPRLAVQEEEASASCPEKLGTDSTILPRPIKELLNIFSRNRLIKLFLQLPFRVQKFSKLHEVACDQEILHLQCQLLHTFQSRHDSWVPMLVRFDLSLENPT